MKASQAKELRSKFLSNFDLEECLDKIYAIIRSYATMGSNSITIYGMGYADSQLIWDAHVVEVVGRLKKNGYNVKTLDTKLEISW